MWDYTKYDRFVTYVYYFFYDSRDINLCLCVSVTSYLPRQPRLSSSVFLDWVLVLATQLIHKYRQQLVSSSTQSASTIPKIKKRGRPRKIFPLVPARSAHQLEMDHTLGMLRQGVEELYSLVTNYVSVPADVNVGGCTHDFPGSSICTG